MGRSNASPEHSPIYMAKYAQSFTAADRTNAAIETERLNKHQEVVRFIAVETAAVRKCQRLRSPII
jgi:hypothetical protein